MGVRVTVNNLVVDSHSHVRGMTWHGAAVTLLSIVAAAGTSCVIALSLCYLVLSGTLIPVVSFLIGTSGIVALLGASWWSSSLVIRFIRRGIRFRLRTLFVFSTLVCVFLWVLLHAFAERRAVTKLRIGGAEVVSSDAPVRRYRVRHLPARMVPDLLALRRVVELSIRDPKLHDTDLERISCLVELSVLTLNGPNITDAGIEHLTTLENLQHLHLYNTQVTDASLPKICRLQSLMGLCIWSPHITDAGLSELPSLYQLHTLDLRGTQITDMGLKQLAKCEHLSTLYLDGTNITDRGLGYLTGLTFLHYISLGKTSVTTAGIAKLQRDFPLLKVQK